MSKEDIKQEPVAVVTGVYGGRFIVEPTNPAMVLPVNMALYTHPQPKAEQDKPVFHLKQYGDVTKEQLDCYIATGRIDTRPQPKQEDYLSKAYRLANELRCHLAIAPAPQQREWVDLTEEDLKLLSAEWRIAYGAWMDDFAKDIEAKLKEKNT